MKYTGPVYRPPFEADSLLLQVTVGCSHNACRFCSMYANTPFETESSIQIEEDLKEAGRRWPKTTRVFLVNGDPFALSADRLKDISHMIHKELPNVRTIAMYAHINNIRTKTNQELAELRALGINDLNIGLESGLDEALAYMNKGYTSADALFELNRLQEAGMNYGLNIIFGVAGAEKAQENALATAECLNAAQPTLIFTGTLHTLPGCQLYDDIKAGRFKENTYNDYLNEEETLIQNLNLNECHYFGVHPSNVVLLEGHLPQHKEKLLTEIQRFRAAFPTQKLNSVPDRYGNEGGISRQ